MESSKEQLADLQSAKETQEKESCQLKEKCKSLEFKLAESLKDQSENRERESSSHEQMAVSIIYYVSYTQGDSTAVRLQRRTAQVLMGKPIKLRIFWKPRASEHEKLLT